MGQYVPSGFEGNLVVDLVDVDSAKFESYAGQRSWPASWLNAREARLLSREEERLANSAEHTLLVSEAEAALMKSRLHSHGSARISALSNGIDADYFDPRDVEPDPALAQSNGPHLVFTGQMDYAPNVAAARRVIDYILPAIRQHYPFAQFHIVGRSPTAELLQFDWKDGVRVWGEVPDVRPFLAAAQVVVAPLEIARGVQNKVLEAMAMACPVVLTSGAATGIDATDGTHFAVEDTDEALSARVHGLLANRGAAQAMGQAAREFVLDRKSWPAMLAGLKSIVGFGHGAKGHLHAA
jgi:sugar transferase (PEP-CTERM/EpsH1 system associated)